MFHFKTFWFQTKIWLEYSNRVSKNFVLSIFYQIQLNLLKYYNLQWHTLKYKTWFNNSSWFINCI